MLKKKHDGINDLRRNFRSTDCWRRSLDSKYNDLRLYRAADALAKLSVEVKNLSDEQWAELEPYYGSRAWPIAVSHVCRQVGFKHADTLDAFVARLVSTLSQAVAV